MLRMIRIGTKVRLGPRANVCDAVTGVILAATIRKRGITSYLVAWWSADNRCEAWVEPDEIVELLVDEKYEPERIIEGLD